MNKAQALKWLTRLAVAIGCVAAENLVETPLSISGPVVNLGYATYEGYYNNTYDLNIWKRYECRFILA
jgi:hypothetical protein